MALLESEAFPSDIEKEANAIFSRIYDGDISMGEIIGLLQAFKSSNDPRERKIFQCMIRSLYEEYPHIPKYPEKELHITGVLFGSLIQYQLVSYIPLVVALRYILEALKQQPNSKLFKFGLYALEQFMNRLHEWPQYCSHLRQIPQLQSFHPQLYRHIEAILVSVSGAAATGGGAGSHFQAGSAGLVPNGGVGAVQGFGGAQNPALAAHHGNMAGQMISPQDQPGYAPEYVDQQPEAYEYRGEGGFANQRQQYRGPQDPQDQYPDDAHQQLLLQQQQQQLHLHSQQQLHMSQEMAYMDPNNAYAQAQFGAPQDSPPPQQFGVVAQQELEEPEGDDLTGHALNIRTLLGSKFAVVEPEEDVVDNVHFIFNNVSSGNMVQKAEDLKQVVNEQHFDYLAQYIVVKRASLEENFHDVRNKQKTQLHVISKKRKAPRTKMPTSRDRQKIHPRAQKKNV